MNDAFIAGVIEVDKELFPVTGEGRRVYGVPMILRRDMTSKKDGVSILIERTGREKRLTGPLYSRVLECCGHDYRTSA